MPGADDPTSASAAARARGRTGEQPAIVLSHRHQRRFSWDPLLLGAFPHASSSLQPWPESVQIHRHGAKTRMPPLLCVAAGPCGKCGEGEESAGERDDAADGEGDPDAAHERHSDACTTSAPVRPGSLRWHRARESESGRSAVPSAAVVSAIARAASSTSINSFRRNEDDTVIVGEHDVVTRDQVFAEARAQERGTCGWHAAVFGSASQFRRAVSLRPKASCTTSAISRTAFSSAWPALRVVGSRARSAVANTSGLPMQAAPCQLGPAGQPARPA